MINELVQLNEAEASVRIKLHLWYPQQLCPQTTCIHNGGKWSLSERPVCNLREDKVTLTTAMARCFIIIGKEVFLALFKREFLADENNQIIKTNN